MSVILRCKVKPLLTKVAVEHLPSTVESAISCHHSKSARHVTCAHAIYQTPMGGALAYTLIGCDLSDSPFWHGEPTMTARGQRNLSGFVV